MEPGLLPRFFERVTRQSFQDLALDDPPVARYLTDLLTRFARTEALYAVRDLPGRRLETVADSLLTIQRVWDWESPDFNPEVERTLRRHIGDYTMVAVEGHQDRAYFPALPVLAAREGRTVRSQDGEYEDDHLHENRSHRHLVFLIWSSSVRGTVDT